MDNEEIAELLERCRKMNNTLEPKIHVTINSDHVENLSYNMALIFDQFLSFNDTTFDQVNIGTLDIIRNTQFE